MADRKKEKPKHLGRGLASLLGPIISEPAETDQLLPNTATIANFPPDKELQDSLQEIALDAVSPNPYQPRTVWNQQELEDLAESIRANGVIQPILVRPAKTGFELIAGERRFRAARLASLKTIPALVRQATDRQLLELTLVENIHRANLNPIERAKAYQNYITTFALTQTEAAGRLGEDRSVIANYLRLLDLPEEIKQMLIASRAMAGRLSVREVERLVRKHLSVQPSISPTARPSKPAHILDLESKLSSRLGTKVSIETRKNGQRGKIIIEFYSLDEFDRIAENIGLAPVEEL
jgi:ParB family chromosome partitioning protein